MRVLTRETDVAVVDRRRFQCCGHFCVGFALMASGKCLLGCYRRFDKEQTAGDERAILKTNQSQTSNEAATTSSKAVITTCQSSYERRLRFY